MSLQVAQERITLSKELVSLAGRVHFIAMEKVLAGKAPPTDSLQSYVGLSLARIDSGRAVEELALARRSLASACGLPDASFDSVQGRLGLGQPVPAWQGYAAQLSTSPTWKRVAFGIKVREAEVQSEKSARLPPLTLEAGIRQVPEKNGRAFVAGATLPLPAWNWNQGAIRAAKSRKAKSEAEAKSQRLDLVESLSARHGEATSAHREASILHNQILPAATATFEGAQEAYRLGKFGSLEALNAQRALFEARAQYLSALKLHHMAMAELEELVGGNPLIRESNAQ